MIELKSKEQCCGCHACESICPKGCITMERDGEGLLYPRVNAVLCIDCGLCERVCPMIRAEKEPIPTGKDGAKAPTAYAAKNKDEAVRLKSSSGGVFTLLAQAVLDCGGVVFGAAFDGARGVHHIAVEAKADLSLLRGSKYVQSRIGDSYRRAKAYLQDGRAVLFSGTPCQIGGLRRYLRKDYENLICQDIICHGVPASAVWEKSLSEREADVGSETACVSFRSKSTGWKDYAVSLTFADGQTREVPHERDPYMKAFLSDLCLRPSCYACAFKGLTREADLTLADFWGIQDVLPAFDDDKGTSLVFVHSERGAKLLQDVAELMELQAVDAALAARYNPSMTSPARRPKNREGFLRELSVKPLADAVKKYTKPSLTVRAKRLVKRILFSNK